MLVKFTFEVLSNFLPFNYNHFVYSMLLDKIEYANKEFAEKIHDTKSFKFFTFSRIEIPERKVTKDKTGFEILSNRVYLFVSSPNENFIRAIIDGLTFSPEIRIGPCKLFFSSANIQEPPDVSKGKFQILTLSPVITTTKKEIGGTLKTWDLLPTDEKFYENLQKNLANKYFKYYGIAPVENSINISKLKPVRTVRTKVKNTYHIGSMLKGEIVGTKDLLKFAFDCGLGEKNSMGFGMVWGRTV